VQAGLSVLCSRIPGWLWLPTWSHCMISTTLLLLIASVSWYVGKMFPLNIHPSTGNWGAKRSCASVPTTSKVAQTPSYAARICFSVGVQRVSGPQYPQLLKHRFWPQLLLGVLCQRLAPGKAMHPSCSTEPILYRWFCTDRPKGYCVRYLLFHLLKGLLFLRAPLKIVLLSGGFTSWL